MLCAHWSRLRRVSSRSCCATALRSTHSSTRLSSSPERIMKTFCSVWLLLSVVELSPAQEPPLPETAEDMASTGDLEPTHYPARRAAQVALHYLNTRHGSPFRVFGLQQVHKASAEDVEAGGRKYKLDFSVTDWASGSAGPALRCSADVLFPRTERHSAPDVKLRCEALQQINRTVQEEEAFYQKHIPPDSAVSARDIPDSYGNMSEEMQPFWRLARVAASFIMLRESSENTEFNMVQMASVTQQESSEEQLMLEFVVLLHDLPSQEIVQWKLLASWSPDRGVRVLQTEWQPRCPHATKPPN
ncbi:latexin isoform X2 [Sinocyclocheilus grahami]|uniref:latexin isoform X2 n=1 Tax=Sinocyclocheilus grahami TaxID=75366 RepID=UPI0007AC6B2B|nr:PREDICTED: latexin-like isoform X2 [Sinocyclocheilus grahami]